MMEDDFDDPVVILGIDCDEEQLEAAELEYPEFDARNTIVISGPLLHGLPLSDEDEQRRMSRRTARRWARTKYGKNLVRMEHHPHRWVARVKRAHFTSGSSASGSAPAP